MLRTVTSGFLPGDDWADEFEAMTLGGELHFRTLVEYLTHFAGRFAAPVTAFGPPGMDWALELTSLCRGLGTEGVVYFANADTIGIRTPGALYRFLRGFGKPVIAAHHLFSPDADPTQARQAWTSWLARTRTR